MAGLFQIRLGSLYGLDISNPFYNMFGYRSFVAVVNEVKELGDHFEAGVIPLIASVLSNAMEITSLDVFELNGTAFNSRSFVPGTHPGTRTGQVMPKFVSWGFKYNRASLGTRSGAKRFGAISEDDQNGGIPTGAALTLLSALAVQLSAPLSVGLIQTWFPVILQRPVSPSTIWTSADLSSVNYSSVTSQNSRKH